MLCCPPDLPGLKDFVVELANIEYIGTGTEPGYEGEIVNSWVRVGAVVRPVQFMQDKDQGSGNYVCIQEADTLEGMVSTLINLPRGQGAPALATKPWLKSVQANKHSVAGFENGGNYFIWSQTAAVAVDLLPQLCPKFVVEQRERDQKLELKQLKQLHGLDETKLAFAQNSALGEATHADQLVEKLAGALEGEFQVLFDQGKQHLKAHRYDEASDYLSKVSGKLKDADSSLVPMEVTNNCKALLAFSLYGKGKGLLDKQEFDQAALCFTNALWTSVPRHLTRRNCKLFSPTEHTASIAQAKSC